MWSKTVGRGSKILRQQCKTLLQIVTNGSKIVRRHLRSTSNELMKRQSLLRI
jgi:hypothetical protein